MSLKTVLQGHPLHDSPEPFCASCAQVVMIEEVRQGVGHHMHLWLCRSP